MRTIKKSIPANDLMDLTPIMVVSAEQIRAVIKFLLVLESINPEDLARVVQPSEFAEDPLVIGNLENHPAVYEFMRACYDDGFVQRTFDWTAWTGEARRCMGDPGLVGTASLATCIKLITAHLRAERFCDGHVGEVVKSGHIAAILRRIKQLADARPEKTQAE